VSAYHHSIAAPVAATCGAPASHAADIEATAAALASFEEVDYVVVAAGSFDILVEVVAESDEHLLDIVSKRIRAIPQVLSTETFVYLQLRKQTYSWGVR